MKRNEPTAPSLAEFKEACRTEFTFLLDYGFEEVPLPQREHSNPFEVHFAKAGWRVIVEGCSYGFGADLTIGSPDGRSGYFHHLVTEDFWSSHRDGLGRGQIGAIRYQALVLKAFGKSFLDGDWHEFDTIMERHAQWQIENKRAWKSYERDREMNQAIEQAKKYFHDGRYSDAAKVLRPFRAELPSSQVKRLDIAEKRSNG